MGALHAGHISLIEAARRESDFVVVTDTVNHARAQVDEIVTTIRGWLTDA